MWCDTITFLRTPQGGLVVLVDDVGRLIKQLPDFPGLTWLLEEHRRCCVASAADVDELL